MDTISYTTRRGEIAHYFDRTAVAAWEKLTSDAPVGRIRASVRAGRDQMRATLLSWLPADMHGQRLLDAGCGTGALAIEAARRGAEVLAIDLSPTLVALARDRAPAALVDGASGRPGAGRIRFAAGDMLDPAFGHFDHVVAMDSLIHYGSADAVAALSALAARTSGSLNFTFAPRTPLLAAMIRVGRLFPRGNRAPWLSPVDAQQLQRLMAGDAVLAQGRSTQCRRVASGFYTSQALQWRRA